MGGMKSKVDLHMHSSASDGVDSIAELLAKVKAAGIACFALTDHDTIAGVLEMEKLLAEQQAGDGNRMQFIRGRDFAYGKRVCQPAGIAAVIWLAGAGMSLFTL